MANARQTRFEAARQGYNAGNVTRGELQEEANRSGQQILPIKTGIDRQPGGDPKIEGASASRLSSFFSNTAQASRAVAAPVSHFRNALLQARSARGKHDVGTAIDNYHKTPSVKEARSDGEWEAPQKIGKSRNLGHAIDLAASSSAGAQWTERYNETKQHQQVKNAVLGQQWNGLPE